MGQLTSLEEQNVSCHGKLASTNLVRLFYYYR